MITHSSYLGVTYCVSNGVYWIPWSGGAEFDSLYSLKQYIEEVWAIDARRWDG